MNRYIRITTLAVFLLLGLTGCDQILDLTPKDQISDQAVFTDPNLAEAFLNDIYIGLGHGVREMMLSSLTDESQFIHNYNSTEVVQSTITSSALGALTRGDFDNYRWERNYMRIRQSNLFLQGIRTAEFPEATKQRMTGEAHFLRAFMYHNLLRMFGGVPIITKVYGLGEDYEAPRNTFEETVNFIVAEADSAAALLPNSHSSANVGRATKGAALALKARVLLYAASDLYNQSPANNLVGYTSGSQADRWRKAKDAAKAVMDLGLYELYNAKPGDPSANFAELFLQKTSKEVILQHFFTQNRKDNQAGLYNGPNGWHNWGGNTPLQNLVDDFRMKDGSKFDWTNPVHAAHPYENRDPRFYATILYDGAPWRARPSDVKDQDPLGIVQTFAEMKLPNGSVIGGLDTRKGPVEDWNGGYSGYYIRKMMDPNINHQFDGQEVPWPYFRYAEILLNYAEASIELNELGDAMNALNQIRRRAGMPEFSGLDQATLREEYRNERRVELAFEEHRYFDVRRWKIAPKEMEEDAMGITIKLEGDSRLARDTWKNYTYTVYKVQDRMWNDKMYFTPITREEMERNSKLVQNPGF